MFKTFNEKRIVDKMFIYILASTIILSTILIIEIIVLNYPLHHTITWIVSIILASISLYFYYLNRFVNTIKITFFGLMTFIVLPYGWLLSDIHSHIPLAYAFIILISICNLLEGPSRFILSVGLILVTIIMLVLNIQQPQLFPVIDNSNLIIDSYIQAPITFGASFFLLSAFANDLRNKNAKLKHLSSVDDLTGLYNRRYVYEYLEKIQSISNVKRQIIIGVIDVNKFKDINDKYGHIIGDKVLQSIANHIKDLCPSSAIISRTGGDEFVIIMTYSKEFNKNAFAESFKKTQINFFHPDCKDAPVITISGGFVVCNITTPIDTMINRADKNMYQAKSEETLLPNNNIIFTEQA